MCTLMYTLICSFIKMIHLINNIQGSNIHEKQIFFDNQLIIEHINECINKRLWHELFLGVVVITCNMFKYDVYTSHIKLVQLHLLQDKQ